MTLTPQDVVSAYKLILGREPESTTVVSNFSTHSNFEHLCATLLNSGEFAERLSRDPRLLSVDMFTLTMTSQFRKYQGIVEMLRALPPIYDRSVLLVGEDSVGQASFYLERCCKLWIAASGDVSGRLRRLLSAHPAQAANVAAWTADFLRPIDEDESLTFDIVQGELPDGGTDAMLTWLDNTAVACGGLLVVTFEAAQAHWEEVFATPTPDDPQRMRRLPTHSWVRARLRERFEHVHVASLAGGGAQGTHGTQGTQGTQGIAIASRHALALPGGGADAPGATAGRGDEALVRQAR